MENELIEIQRDLKLILQNHLPHIGADISGIKKDVGWLKKAIWYVIPALVMALWGAMLVINR